MLIISATLALLAGASNPCQIKGRIQYVTSSADADLRVKVVTPSTDALPDLRVQEVSWIANSPGQWKIVTHSPDYKVMKVTGASYDFTITYVNRLPGCRLGC